MKKVFLKVIIIFVILNQLSYSSDEFTILAAVNNHI